MKYRLFLLLFFIATSLRMFASTSSFADDRIDELYKKYATLMNKIRTETNCLVVPHEENDGFCYFELTKLGNKNELLRGIYSIEGKEIVPVNYNDIEYCPALDDGFTDDSFPKWHAKTDRTFLASVNKKNGINIYTIFGADGVIKQENIEATNMPFLTLCHSGYLEFEKREGLQIKYGLYSSDGRLIAPIEYDKIQIQGKLCLTYKKTNMGADEYLCGATVIDKSLNLPDVPCKFFRVTYDKDKNSLMVRNRGNGDYEIPYQVNMYESSTYTEDLYFANLPNSCISYCMKQYIDGKENIHDLFFMADCLFDKAKSPYYQARSLAEYIKTGQLTEIIRYAFYREYDFEGVKDVYNIAYRMFFEYTQRVDKYIEQNDISQEEAERTTYYKNKANYLMDRILSDLKSLESFKEEFQPIWESFANENKKLKIRMNVWNEDAYPSVSQAIFAAMISDVWKPTESVTDLCNSTNILNKE